MKKPQILLIYPKPSVAYDTTHCLALGLAYIAAVLEKNNFKVKVIDFNVQKPSLAQKLKNIDIVGIFTLTPNIYNSWRLAQKIKKINQKIWVVLGGPHASSLPEESLAKKQVDAVVRQEGEITFLEVCQAWPAKDFSKIKGLSFRKNKKIVNNSDRPYIKDLDSLPMPAWHLFPLEKYGSTRPTWIDQSKVVVGTVITSRGCPYHCIFCFKGVHGCQYRFRSPESVLAELKILKEKFGVNFVEFQDDNFNLIPGRALKICKLLVKEKLNIKWSIPNGLSRVDNLSQEFLSWAKKSGCVDVWFAVESGSQRVLDKVIGKKTKISQIKRAVKLAKIEGFQVGGFVCLGNPGETEKDMQKTIDFVCKLSLDRCQFTIVTPFPGSRLFAQMKEQNKLLTYNWDDYGPFENKVYIADPVAKPEIVRKMYRYAFRRFYLRPSYIVKALTRITTYKNIKLILQQLWRFAK